MYYYGVKTVSKPSTNARETEGSCVPTNPQMLVRHPHC